MSLRGHFLPIEGIGGASALLLIATELLRHSETGRLGAKMTLERGMPRSDFLSTLVAGRQATRACRRFSCSPI